MAFGIGVNSKEADCGKIKGTQTEIACKCWFTSKGRAVPMMIKVQDESGMIRTVDEIHVNYAEERNYAGVPTVEYDCLLGYQGACRNVKLVFFKNECRWVMREG